MKPTVLMAHPSSSLYGADRMMLESVKAMVSDGWQTVVALPEDGPLVPLLIECGASVRVVDVPVLRRSNATPKGAVDYSAASAMATGRIRSVIREVEPDVVYVNTLTFPMWIAGARSLRIPSVCHVHEAEPDAPRVVRAGLNGPLWLADRVIVNSHAARSVVVDAHPGLAKRTVVLHNGFAFPAQVTAPRETLTGRIDLIVVGRLSLRKGTDVAIRAVSDVVNRGHDVHLNLVGSVFRGNEPFEQSLHELVERLGLNERVRFSGLIHDVWPAFAEADIAVMPSRAEPFGNTAVEAMLARRPLVASWIQGIREIVAPGKTGLVATAGDIDSLADAIEATIVDWPAAITRSDEAYTDAQRRFSPDRYAAELRAAVTEAAHSPRSQRAKASLAFGDATSESASKSVDEKTPSAPAAMLVSSSRSGANTMSSGAARVKTVLIAQPSASLYGADRMLVRSVSALQAGGWRVAVAISEDGPLITSLEQTGARVVIVPTPVLRRAAASPKGIIGLAGENVAAWSTVRRFIRSANPDLVYVNTLTSPLWLAVAKSMGIPAACHVREAEDAVSPLIRSALTAPLQLADVVIANSSLTRNVIIAAQPRLARRTVVVHNGFSGPGEVEPARRELQGAIELVAVGRLSARKGTDVLLEAADQLVRRGHDINLTLVGAVFRGNEAFQEQLIERSSRDELAGRVRFRGLVDDVWPEYAAADIALVPSVAEPFGNTAVEAMMARRPLVASWVQGLREIVSPGTTGLAAAPGDSESLADAIELTIRDWPAALTRAETAYVDAHTRFSPERYAAALSYVVGAAARREPVEDRASFIASPPATMSPPVA